MALRIAFIRDDERRDNVHVTRVDGSVLRWIPPGGPGIPHDLLHWLVETDLGLDRAFWGLVADGMDFAAASEAAHGESPLAGRDTTQLMQAEAAAAAVNARLTLDGVDDAYCVAYARELCVRQEVVLPEGFDEGAVARLAGSLRGLSEEWTALAPRGTLLRRFPRAPEAPP